MSIQGAGALGQADELKACIGNLVCLFAIPAISSGGDSRRIIAASLDLLLGMLRLEFAYASFIDPTNGSSTVLTRTQSGGAAPARRHIAPIIVRPLPDRTPMSAVVVSATRRGAISIARLRLGLDDETGVILAVSRRKDFPTEIERLLLGVTANQVTNRLRDARLLGEQRLVATKLEQKIARQAAALATANRELAQARSLIERLRDDQAGSDDRNGSARIRGGLAPWQLQRAKELMTADLQGHVPLSRLAEQCGLSTRHFARAFRQSSGVPPHRWLLNHRVDHAKELLSNLEVSLAEIALACGFADQSHFTRIFTTLVHRSPGLWRRMQAWRIPAGGARTDSSRPADGDASGGWRPPREAPRPELATV